MILLIDNYDSFSYNLYQLTGSVESDIKVIRNDEYTIEEIEKMEPDALIISPGPGRPDAVRLMQPWALDLSSSVETDKIKDREKIMQVMRTVRSL